MAFRARWTKSRAATRFSRRPPAGGRLQASWRNWQTRWIQNPLPSRAYRFDSDRGHCLAGDHTSGLHVASVMSSAGFCPKCLDARGEAGTACHRCGVIRRPLFDATGALSRKFLLARGNCCGSGCRNCPYPVSGDSSSAPTANPVQKTCEACGRSFLCGGPQCWCESVLLSRETLDNLRRTHLDCLCPQCLAARSG